MYTNQKFNQRSCGSFGTYLCTGKPLHPLTAEAGLSADEMPRYHFRLSKAVLRGIDPATSSKTGFADMLSLSVQRLEAGLCIKILLLFEVTYQHATSGINSVP